MRSESSVRPQAFHALVWLKKNAPPGIAAVSLPVSASIHSIINARAEVTANRQQRSMEMKFGNAMNLLGLIRHNCARAGTGDAGVRDRLHGFRDLQDPVRELLFWRIYRRMVRAGIKTGKLKPSSP